ncbi:MAG: tRNA glutamyl-Q(34) synthetase GluQRS [Pseudomonadales bacterium]|nr:tRNA glutamyl-Q(34) synthetase GluQRS [Pseudomonadales bacterium]NIX09359.1 tRNA glutamyl-Q(34) synthetase GluQRS [Pseudomonadales bacterium]
MAGRFAPSPTGPLHLGSLLAATASYLDARAAGEAWRLRFDDLDVPRNDPQALQSIITTLKAHGLIWDGPILHQSDNGAAYADALNRLAGMGLLFYCTCSRRKLRNEAVYPGTCRSYREPRHDSATRVRVDHSEIVFVDRIQGTQSSRLDKTTGDFIVRRRDGLVAYQLATAVDDGADDVTSVVRGADLLDNTPRQIYLMQLLGLQPPSYAHIPVLLNPDGSKLSKQTMAPPVDDGRAPENLIQAYRLLGLHPPADAAQWEVEGILSWGISHWDHETVPRRPSIGL